MRLAYVDCFAGITGELLLGALLDAGLSLDALRDTLAGLSVAAYTLDAQQVVVGGVGGTQVVLAPATLAHVPYSRSEAAHAQNGTGAHHELGPAAYSELISRSDLPAEAKHKSLAALRALLAAENAPQPPGQPPRPADMLRDVVLIVACACGLVLLGVESVVCSPINVGGGTVVSGTSISPVPGLVVARILQAASVPIYGTDTNRDLVSPVGAALAVAVASSFGPAPLMPVSSVGYAMSGVPTVPGLRVILGDVRHEPARHDADAGHAAPQGQAATLIEATLDDTNPQYYDFIVERLLWQGAQEVFLVPVQMKMNRPGVVLSVICEPEQTDSLCDIIFEETSTDNVRISPAPRRTVHREMAQVPTRWGPVKVKIGRNSEGRLLHVKPDYEDVKRLALEHNVPVERVYEEARCAWSPYSPDAHQQPGRQRYTPTTETLRV